MAKKKSAESPTTTKRRRTAAAPAAPPVDIAGVTAVEPIDTAADRSGGQGDLRHEEIAEAAYHRYLKRGSGDGRDFDDWLEAERELRTRTR